MKKRKRMEKRMRPDLLPSPKNILYHRMILNGLCFFLFFLTLLFFFGVNNGKENKNGN